MSLTQEEFERRRVVVGASEVGLLFGLPAFGGKTLSDLWFEKKYGTVSGSKGNASTALGTRLEPVILSAAEDRLGTAIIDRQKWVIKGSNGATLDGRLESTGAVIDAKTSGIIGPNHLAEWGDDGSDDVPDSYLLQIQAQMLVTGAELGWLAALIGGRGFAMFQIQPQAALMQAIQTKSEAFIASLDSEEPPAEPPQLDTLKRIRRQPEKVLPRSSELDQLYERFEQVNATAKDAEKSKEQLQRQLLAMLGDAEAAECNGGLLTYFQQSRKESVTPASTFRVMRFQKGR